MDLSQELIGEILGKVRELDADGRVRFIALYGSLVEGGGSGLSDIDVALYYDGSEEERFSFRVALQGELGERFDVQIFQDLPLYVRREIVARGKVIFYTDYDFLFNVYLQTLREYSDFERHLRTYYSYLEGAEVEGNG
jgi:predicted nucleotidyltransferase